MFWFPFGAVLLKTYHYYYYYYDDDDDDDEDFYEDEDEEEEEECGNSANLCRTQLSAPASTIHARTYIYIHNYNLCRRTGLRATLV